MKNLEEIKKKWPPTMSRWLIELSNSWLIYPFRRQRRSRSNLAVQQFADEYVHRHVEWRKTFALAKIEKRDEASSIWDAGIFLHQFYCRDLLQRVPEIVERTQKLSQLSLSEIKDPQSFVYLREAANCYILGLPQAAIAMSRAAVESSLKATLAKHFGEKAVSNIGLKGLIDDLSRRGRFLSAKGRMLADKVRESGDDVLHQLHEKKTATSALDVIESARSVILELGG